MDKKTVYRIGGKDYDSIYALRRALPSISIPDNPTDEQLQFMKVLKLEINYKPDEAKQRRIQQLYYEYQNEFYNPTIYKVNGNPYYFSRQQQDVVKFTAAHEVAKIKGENEYKATDSKGQSVLINLTLSDFESILVKSSMEQRGAYNRFIKARTAVQNYKRADKIFSVEL